MKSKMLLLKVLCLVLWGFTSVASAGFTYSSPVYHVSIDVSSLMGQNLELEAQLYNLAGINGDSRALIDNVTFGAAVEDFESGTPGGFVDDPFNDPGTFSVVPGSLNGTGNYLLQLDTGSPLSTLTYVDFWGDAVSSLDFDVQFFTNNNKDNLVFTLYDWYGSPLLPGLPCGGDVIINRSGIQPNPTVVPAPGALLLGCIGLGTLTGLRRKLAR